MHMKTRVKSVAAMSAVAAVAAAAAAGTAGAAVVTLQDDATVDFVQGLTAGTVVRDPGTVALAKTFEDPFDGAALSSSWTSTPWTPGPGAGTTTVAGGEATVDGALLKSTTAAGPGSSVEFTGDIGTLPYRHLGFADFATDRWAIFSTGNDSEQLPTGFYARTSDGGTAINTPVPAVSGTHRFRIDWTATGFDFFIDDVKVVTPAAAAQSDPLPFVASDFVTDLDGVDLDAATFTTRTSGTFTSRLFEPGDQRVTGATLTGTADGAVAYETRTSDTLVGLDSAPWTPVGSGGAVAGGKRYLRYRATLTTPNPGVSPLLGKVAVSFTIDDRAPVVTLGEVKVAGTQAEVAIAADEAATVTCSLDGKAFAPCASPATFTGLAAGAHTLTVRAVDAVGNTGEASRSFTIAGRGTPPAGNPPAGTPADTSAPAVLVLGRKLSVAGRMTSLRVRCPRAEDRCIVSVRLRRGGKTIARRTATLASGETRSFTLRLTKAARKALTLRSSLKATAKVTATDAAGNRTTTRRAVTLKG